MKILLIGTAGSIHIRRWAASLAERGLDVSVLSRRHVPIAGARLIPAEVPRWTPWRPQPWTRRRRAMLKRIVRQLRPDLVHLHYLGAYSVFPEDLADVPLVVNTWGSDVVLRCPETVRQRKVKLDILNAARCVRASSRYLARATCEYAGWSSDRVVTNYWGVDLEQFTPPGTRCDEPVIGFVKALEPHYGPDVLLRAFARTRKAVPAARLLVAGRGQMEGSLKRQAAELGIASAVEWLAHVDYADVPALFARMSVSAMPSTYEALGMAALESQAMKVPVVGSTAGGIPEVVIDGKTGILVPPRDDEALANAIINILSDRQLRHRLGEQARRHVEQHFDWNKTIDRMIATYAEALVPSPKGRGEIFKTRSKAGSGSRYRVKAS